MFDTRQNLQKLVIGKSWEPKKIITAGLQLLGRHLFLRNAPHHGLLIQDHFKARQQFLGHTPTQTWDLGQETAGA